MKKTYLIDSENVNEIWVELVDVLCAEDEILVFYTDKSAHMSYDRIIRLIEQKIGTIRWIKCFGGQNALDFQLVTELGYCINQEPDKEYIIVSNDMGYDAAVRYWKQRACNVRRIRGTECEKIVRRQQKETEAEVCHVDAGLLEKEAEFAEEKVMEEEPYQVVLPICEKEEIQQPQEPPQPEMGSWGEQIMQVFHECGSRDPETDMVFLTSLCKTIRMSNMSMMHNILEYQFGQRAGNGIYRFLKENPECRSYLSAGYSNSKKQREREYLQLVLGRNGMNPADTDLILRIINALPRKNLNAIHVALVKKFGQEKGGAVYAVIRSHVKIIRGL